MSATGPTTIGGTQSNNATSINFHPSAAVPAGAFLVVSLVTSGADTGTYGCADNKGNVYQIQSQNQPIGSPITLVLFLVPVAVALATPDTITITSDTRQQLIAGALFYTNAQVSLLGFDIEYNNATTLNPAPTLQAKAGQNLLAIIVVNGPQSDGFVQATGFGTDIGGGVGNAGYSIHGGAQVAAADGQFTYNPTLGRARFSVSFLLLFT